MSRERAHAVISACNSAGHRTDGIRIAPEVDRPNDRFFRIFRTREKGPERGGNEAGRAPARPETSSVPSSAPRKRALEGGKLSDSGIVFKLITLGHASKAVLIEIPVKGEGLMYAFAPHNGETETIYKTETFIVIAFEDLQGLPDILHLNPFDQGKLLREGLHAKLGSDLVSPGRLIPHPEESDRLSDDIVGGYQSLLITFQPPSRCLMIGIVRHLQGIPGSGVYKDHRCPP